MKLQRSITTLALAGLMILMSATACEPHLNKIERQAAQEALSPEQRELAECVQRMSAAYLRAYYNGDVVPQVWDADRPPAAAFTTLACWHLRAGPDRTPRPTR